MPKPGVEFSIDETTWNDEVVAAAWREPYDDARHEWLTYGASKTEAEREAWKFVKEQRPDFVLNTVLPDMVFGPLLWKDQSASTGEFPQQAFKGDLSTLTSLPPLWFVDARDVGRLHVAATLNPELQGERLLGFSEPFNCNKVLHALRKIYLDRDFPNDIANGDIDRMKVDTGRAVEQLKAFGQSGFIGFEDSIRENTKHLVA